MVLLPGSMVVMPSGPPSSYALQMRPWLLLVLALLLFVAVARFMVLDVIGGFFIALTVAIGWWSLRDGMEMMWLLCLSIVFFLNAVFDGFILVLRVMRTPKAFFGDHLPWYMNVAHGVLLAGPVLELLGARICWLIYKDHLSNLPGEVEDLYPEFASAYGTHSPPEGAGQHERLVRPPQERFPSGFKAFQGMAHRLTSA
mmetsp:Transcript_9190/g.20472  ORF Transcript_9190/g.20472 Transcript_9190/m.20472 type:complete len:199 (-) Transcript_9190:54-650(-)